MSGSLVVPAVVLVVLAVGAGIDLQHLDRDTLVVYTTPALQDYLDKWAIPEFKRETGLDVQAVYGLSAGEEVARLRLSHTHPEADVFLHASPLMLQQGIEQGLWDVYQPALDVGAANRSAVGPYWTAFAWSPMVEVYGAHLARPPDLATGHERLGLAHPILSNNGVYVALLYEAVAPEARQAALDRTRVQPSNSKTTIGGVADGSFDAALGYEAVARQFKDRGAAFSTAWPVFSGTQATTPVLFCSALVHGHHHQGATEFLDMLYTPAAQAALGKYYLRPMQAGVPGPAQAMPVEGVRMVAYDWSHANELAAKLPAYEVQR